MVPFKKIFFDKVIQSFRDLIPVRKLRCLLPGYANNLSKTSGVGSAAHYKRSVL